MVTVTFHPQTQLLILTYLVSLGRWAHSCLAPIPMWLCNSLISSTPKAWQIVNDQKIFVDWMEENTLLYYVLQVCLLWEIVRSCRLRTILVIFVPSVPTQHRTCLINIGSRLHTYCEAEHLFSAHRERIIWLGDGEGRSAKLVVTVSQQEQHTDQARMPRRLPASQCGAHCSEYIDLLQSVALGLSEKGSWKPSPLTSLDALPAFGVISLDPLACLWTPSVFPLDYNSLFTLYLPLTWVWLLILSIFLCSHLHTN